MFLCQRQRSTATSEGEKENRDTKRHREPHLLAIAPQTVSGAHRYCPLHAWYSAFLSVPLRANKTAGDRALSHSRRKIQQRKSGVLGFAPAFPTTRQPCTGVRGCWCRACHVRQLPRRESPVGKQDQCSDATAFSASHPSLPARCPECMSEESDMPTRRGQATPVPYSRRRGVFAAWRAWDVAEFDSSGNSAHYYQFA